MPRAIVIRMLAPDDSIHSLTELVRDAYSPLGERGWNFNGVDQAEEVTAQRVALGVCLVAECGGTLMGTITVHGPFQSAPCEYIARQDIAFFQQFAVRPRQQNLGVGGALLQQAEACARQAGYAYLCTDTADGADHLLSFYTNRGYRPVARMQWPGKTYRSVVLSKQL